MDFDDVVGWLFQLVMLIFAFFMVWFGLLFSIFWLVFEGGGNLPMATEVPGVLRCVDRLRALLVPFFQLCGLLALFFRSGFVLDGSGTVHFRRSILACSV